MTASIGIDVVSVARVGRLLSQQPTAAAELFTERELSYCGGKRRSLDHLAARFAAKEAVLKAIGTGLGARMRWTDVEVVNDCFGRPTAVLRGEVAATAGRKRLGPVELSMSHSAGMAVAVATARAGVAVGEG